MSEYADDFQRYSRGEISASELMSRQGSKMSNKIRNKISYEMQMEKYLAGPELFTFDYRTKEQKQLTKALMPYLKNLKPEQWSYENRAGYSSELLKAIEGLGKAYEPGSNMEKVAAGEYWSPDQVEGYYNDVIAPRIQERYAGTGMAVSGQRMSSEMGARAENKAESMKLSLQGMLGAPAAYGQYMEVARAPYVDDINMWLKEQGLQQEKIQNALNFLGMQFVSGTFINPAAPPMLPEKEKRNWGATLAGVAGTIAGVATGNWPLAISSGIGALSGTYEPTVYGAGQWAASKQSSNLINAMQSTPSYGSSGYNQLVQNLNSNVYSPFSGGTNFWNVPKYGGG